MLPLVHLTFLGFLCHFACCLCLPCLDTNVDTTIYLIASMQSILVDIIHQAVVAVYLGMKFLNITSCCLNVCCFGQMMFLTFDAIQTPSKALYFYFSFSISDGLSVVKFFKDLSRVTTVYDPGCRLMSPVMFNMNELLSSSICTALLYTS